MAWQVGGLNRLSVKEFSILKARIGYGEIVHQSSLTTLASTNNRFRRRHPIWPAVTWGRGIGTYSEETCLLLCVIGWERRLMRNSAWSWIDSMICFVDVKRKKDGRRLALWGEGGLSLMKAGMTRPKFTSQLQGMSPSNEVVFGVVWTWDSRNTWNFKCGWDIAQKFSHLIVLCWLYTAGNYIYILSITWLLQ
jgi:hypothetical protein